MLACKERRTQKVEASFAVDGHSHTIAEDFWVTEARLAHTVLHVAGIRAVHHCARQQKSLLEVFAQFLYSVMHERGHYEYRRLHGVEY